MLCPLPDQARSLVRPRRRYRGRREQQALLRAVEAHLHDYRLHLSARSSSCFGDVGLVRLAETGRLLATELSLATWVWAKGREDVFPAHRPLAESKPVRSSVPRRRHAPTRGQCKAGRHADRRGHPTADCGEPRGGRAGAGAGASREPQCCGSGVRGRDKHGCPARCEWACLFLADAAWWGRRVWVRADVPL
jgi:hypothetical protein